MWLLFMFNAGGDDQQINYSWPFLDLSTFAHSFLNIFMATTERLFNGALTHHIEKLLIYP